MTDNEINIAVAGKLGWRKKRQIDRELWVWFTPTGETVGQSKILKFSECLNAMHEAEKTLSTVAREQYMLALETTVSDSGEWFSYVHATARQRAEAFLRVYGLWRE